MVNNSRKVSFLKPQKQSSTLTARRTVTEQRESAQERENGEADSPAAWSHPDLSEIASKDQNIDTKWVITKGRVPEHRGYHIWDDIEILLWLPEEISLQILALPKNHRSNLYT
jgi:hypothetical protein